MKDTFPLRKPNELPKDWFQVSIADLPKLDAIRLLYKDLELTQHVIKHFIGLSIEETNGYTEKEFLALKSHLNFLDNAPSTLWQKTICIEGKTYRFSYKRERLTAWQMIQLQNLSTDYLNNLHLIAAVIFTDGKPEHGFDERAELFLSRMPVGVILPVAAFFLNLLQGLLKATQTSLERKMRKTEKKQKKNGLAENGAGTPLSTT